MPHKHTPMMPPFPSLRLPERWQIPVLAVAGVGALAATTMAAAAGFTAVIAQTFYIPIILAVVWYRWRGLAVVAAITAAYIPILGWFTGFASPAFPEAVARAAVMIAVAMVLAALSSHVSALARDYPGIFQHAGDGYIIVDQQSLAVLDLNRTAAEMIGFAPSEVVGRSLVSLFADPATAEGTAEALKAGQDLDVLEAALTMRGGGVRWVRIVSGSLPEDRVVCTLLDISRQKEDERTMRALARLAGESPDPVLRIGPGGQILYANEAAMAVIGAEAPGEKSEARAALSRAAAEATATGDQVELEVRVGNGTFLITVVPIEGEDYVNLYGKDITGIKAAETAIRLNEQRLEALRGLDRMYDAPLKAITDYALSCAISMTGSEHGYFAFLDPEERTLTMQSWSDRAMAVCRVENPQNTYILAETGLWGEPVRQRHRVILNDYAAPSPLKKGTPPGHPAIRRFLSVPVFEGERIVAVAGVINKAAPYDEDDARQFSLLMTGMWGLVRRKRYSDDLKRSEALYRTIFEATGAATMILDGDGMIVHANARFRHFGYDPADIVGRSAWTSVFDGPMHNAGWQYHQIHRIEREKVPVYEGQVLDADGKVRDALVTAAMIPETDLSVVSVMDITPLKEAEREIAVKNRELAALAEVSAITSSLLPIPERLDAALAKVLNLMDFETGAIYLFEGKGDVGVRVSQRWPADMEAPYEIKRLAVPSEPRYSSDRPEGVPPHIRERFASYASIPLKVGDEISGTLNMATRREHVFTTGEREFLETSGRAIGGAVLRARFSEDLERANADANLYLDIMTHDINNANTVAVGYCGLLLPRLAGKEHLMAKKVLAGIRQSIEIIMNVSTYRSLSQRATRVEPVPLDAAIRSEIARFSELDIRYAGTDAVVMADDLLTEVFTNLIGNAGKFGGPEVTVWIAVVKEDDRVAVTVADNGPGIPDDQKENVFGRFVRNAPRVSGKGLGLWICRMLAERYGGSIAAGDRVPGSPGEGAAITLVLRRAGD
ncbi:multi-sensor signal transduction histidine kinase [Methanofollis liminatans DSM 4140]|uniref:histidine kinase n=2 Tax=Methanofollis liminatans TaxID=2201 RepID=J0SBN5_9EURY|nr:multi-sensor signal transduction histidine kinase [Methanofollis liminatans DSM 4140]